MQIIGQRIVEDSGVPVRFERSPNQSERDITPRHILLHYTAGRSFEDSIAWLCNPKARASAHIVIGRGGEVAQLVDLHKRAWHAGKSKWQETVGMNNHSIGIELDNAGLLTRRAAGWYTWFGVRIDAADVVLAEERAWHAYTEPQVLRAYEVCEALIDRYPAIGEREDGILGHSDVAPGRKVDPGPAWNMDSFRAWLYGRGAG